jgi:hypothetical protein
LLSAKKFFAESFFFTENIFFTLAKEVFAESLRLSSKLSAKNIALGEDSVSRSVWLLAQRELGRRGSPRAVVGAGEVEFRTALGVKGGGPKPGFSEDGVIGANRWAPRCCGPAPAFLAPPAGARDGERLAGDGYGRRSRPSRTSRSSSHRARGTAPGAACSRVDVDSTTVWQAAAAGPMRPSTTGQGPMLGLLHGFL